MSTSRKPRIIFNDDNWKTLRRDVPQPYTPEKVSLALDLFKNTQVDWLCWSMNSGTIAFSWKSDVIENIFNLSKPETASSVASRFDDIATFDISNTDNLMLSLYRQEIDYLPVLIERTHQAGMNFISSFRMNDCHHKSYPDGTLAGEFWRIHPEYRLWEITDGKTYYNAALNYGIQEVRDRMLATIQEVLDRYDVDGIELDWCRNPYALPPSRAWDNRDVMTGFTKTIRDIINNTTQMKGKAIKLIVRVPANETKLHDSGLDVWTWANNNLIDVLVTSCLVNDYDIDLKPWRELAENNDLWYYHCIEAGPATNAPAHNHVPPETFEEGILRMRGAAQNILAQQTDGVYLFNFRGRLDTSTEEARIGENEILAELGQLETLQGKSKQYTFWKDLPIQLESWRPPQYHQTLQFNIRDSALESQSGQAVLQFRQVAQKSPHVPRDIEKPPQILPDEWVLYFLNGRQIDPKRLVHKPEAGRVIESGFDLPEHELIEIVLEPDELKAGENELAFHIPKIPEECDPYVYIYQFTVTVNI